MNAMIQNDFGCTDLANHLLERSGNSEFRRCNLGAMGFDSLQVLVFVITYRGLILWTASAIDSTCKKPQAPGRRVTIPQGIVSADDHKRLIRKDLSKHRTVSVSGSGGQLSKRDGAERPRPGDMPEQEVDGAIGHP
jgi:hypothetical protein